MSVIQLEELVLTISSGWCGTTSDYCSATSGCQSAFGICNNATNTTTPGSKAGTSTDNRCGPGVGTCASDECCSLAGYCGTTEGIAPHLLHTHTHLLTTPRILYRTRLPIQLRTRLRRQRHPYRRKHLYHCPPSRRIRSLWQRRYLRLCHAR